MPGSERARARPDPRRRDRGELLAVLLGGGLGAVARAALDEWLPVTHGAWPWSTFIANVVAALALGYLAARLLEGLPVSRYCRPLLATGLCGGLSTFSTLQVEAVRLLQQHAYAVAVGYLLASVLVGMLALHLGTSLARRTTGVRTTLLSGARR